MLRPGRIIVQRRQKGTWLLSRGCAVQRAAPVDTVTTVSSDDPADSTPHDSARRAIDTTARDSATNSTFNPQRYWHRRLKRDWSLHGVGLKRLSRSYNRWVYRVRRAVFRRTVRGMRLDTDSLSVLDVGSGTGFYLDLWHKFGARHIAGIDIADSAVNRLRTRLPDVCVERADVSDEPPFPEGTFDVVSAFDVLFHIVDDQRYHQAISNIHRLLAAGGQFVFSEKFVHHKRTDRRHHVNRTCDEIENLIRAEGFEIISRKPMFVFMTSPADSTQQWRRNLWSNRIRPAVKHERRGNMVGAVLYPIELLLTRVLREGPAMEIMVCRKPASTAGVP